MSRTFVCHKCEDKPSLCIISSTRKQKDCFTIETFALLYCTKCETEYSMEMESDSLANNEYVLILEVI